MPAMLSALQIRNLALVEHLDWEPGSGFIAVTGETGAGKSIILGALDLILGERADRSIIRSGADQCSVEAIFRFGDTRELDARLAEIGVEPCEGGELILKRGISASGANRQFVNCSPTTLAAFREIGEDLVDLHGPHDHQSLFAGARQLDLLDAFAGLAPILGEYRTAFSKLRDLQKELEELAGVGDARDQQIALLRYQVGEIESAAVNPEEDAALEARYRLAADSRRIVETVTLLVQRLEEGEDSVADRLAETQRLFRDLERFDPTRAELGERHAEAARSLAEIARELRVYADSLDLDPAQLARMEERINLLQGLRRKYGQGLDEIVAFGERAAEQLRRIEHRGEEIARLETEIASARSTLGKIGARLTKARAEAAPKLAREVGGHLADLGFKKPGFDIELSRQNEPSRSGFDGVEFLFAPNPGEPSRPLRAIASSGEISRVMLALKTALAAQDDVPLLVFDEIDANVGGEIAHAVGEKMRRLGEGRQVLCITHLAQVACRASGHFVVRKQQTGGRTLSMLETVEGKAREEEIARMLGGRSGTELALARSLLSEAASR